MDNFATYKGGSLYFNNTKYLKLIDLNFENNKVQFDQNLSIFNKKLGY